VAYHGTTAYDHAAPSPIGILLTNVGSPAAPTRAALRPYLSQFLGDERVIEYPRWLWQPLLHGVILNTRPGRSAKLYERVWTADGSPLWATLQRQAAALQTLLSEQLPTPIMVVPAVRYGEPSIAAGLRRLAEANARRVLVFPLFPQYSATTTATSLDAVFDELKTWRWVPELRTINQYHDHPDYIAALANSVHEQWAETGRPQRLMLSFHGVPRDYVLKGDPYYCGCQKTARLLAEALKLGPDDYAVTFQSRFGPTEWLQPYTDQTLIGWGQAGLTHVDALCPGFSADCLETTDEVGHEGKLSYEAAGGSGFHYIPALNDRPDHIAALAAIAQAHLGGWLEPDARRTPTPAELAAHHARLGLTAAEAEITKETHETTR
jgi:ferrochelatase